MNPLSGRLRWLWKAPVRALGRARDYYVRSITGCARYVPADAAFGAYPVLVPIAPLPRSYSSGDWAGAGEEDLRELIRASSQRRDDQQRQVVQAVARSQSTAVGRSMAPINEDAPCEFGGGGVGGLYSRSQSYAGGVAGRPRFHRK
ncbi:uncharacterized protein LOC124697535 [Lolium rigidum]|uniref:uncharacterized protein LOC124697535 n=1 Tax=Lolium rigidum TaxID=89674 RepID=UPI001F5CE470|nr:uncharacterized protein LOC124697535 [Lolium rigidum]